MPNLPNNIYAPEGAFEDASEGDEVEMQVAGVLHDDEHGKWVEVKTVDGQPVGGPMGQEDQMNKARGDMMGEVGKLGMESPWKKTEDNY